MRVLAASRQPRTAHEEQPHAAHLHDVHQIVVVEMLVKADTALLHGRCSNRDGDARRDVDAMTGDAVGPADDDEQEEDRQRRTVVIDDEAELVVSKHPPRVDDELHRCGSGEPRPGPARERRAERGSEQQKARGPHADGRDLPEDCRALRAHRLLKSVIRAAHITACCSRHKGQCPQRDTALAGTGSASEAGPRKPRTGCPAGNRSRASWARKWSPGIFSASQVDGNTGDGVTFHPD